VSATDVVAASAPIGPNQHFVGLVNGKHVDAVVYTICPGPGTGDGPPVSGQTVAVRRVASGGGDTGTGAHVIYARVTPTTIVELKAYRRAEPIPTSARVPCQGTGTITFSTCPLPQPCGAGSAVDNVSVRFINMGA
jgi:hypothetical protein